MQYIDLIAEALGGRVLYANDDFFAPKENLIRAGRGIFIPDKYTDRGKWMDGWESRRRRTHGNDWCIIQLATPGIVRSFDIDTNHFLGNHPPFASVEGTFIASNEVDLEHLNASDYPWQSLLPKSLLQPGSQNEFEASSNAIVSHLRLSIYPDGGVARFRAYGEVKKDWSAVSTDELIDLGCAIHGARVLACNDMFFSHANNLILPSKGKNMGDGWETKRNRTPNNVDWLILQLAHPGYIERVVVDTAHFKGNYPDCCALSTCYSPTPIPTNPDQIDWQPLLEPSKLGPDQEHVFTDALLHYELVSHVRFNIYPDGGVSRLRLFGTVVSIISEQ